MRSTAFGSNLGVGLPTTIGSLDGHPAPSGSNPLTWDSGGWRIPGVLGDAGTGTTSCATGTAEDSATSAGFPAGSGASRFRLERLAGTVDSAGVSAGWRTARFRLERFAGTIAALNRIDSERDEALWFLHGQSSLAACQGLPGTDD